MCKPELKEGIAGFYSEILTAIIGDIRAWGGIVVQALSYWSEGPGDPRRSPVMSLGEFFHGILQLHVSGVDSAS
jgi:hypothetical protein